MTATEIYEKETGDKAYHGVKSVYSGREHIDQEPTGDYVEWLESRVESHHLTTSIITSKEQ